MMQKKENAGRWYLCFIGAAIVFVGLVFVALMWRSYNRAAEMRNWPEIDAIVLKSDLGLLNFGNDKEYFFDVLYRYDFEGVSYESNRLSLRGGFRSNSSEKANLLVNKYPVSSVIKIHVNPHQPNIAVIQMDSKAPLYSIWFPGLFVIAGTGMMLSAWKR